MINENAMYALNTFKKIAAIIWMIIGYLFVTLSCCVYLELFNRETDDGIFSHFSIAYLMILAILCYTFANHLFFKCLFRQRYILLFDILLLVTLCIIFFTSNF